jgi:hypothetical protein
MSWSERPLDGCLEALADSPPMRGRKGKPGFALLSVNDKREGITLLLINKENDHLAIAVLRAVIRAGAIRVSQPGDLQVERLHDTEAGAGQLLIDPCLHLFTSQIES